ncbi:MAG: AMP-binding protein [Hungatella sp.]|jgi:acyl-CoA synthetase (AMP-forming)/AMP-acid ligase II/3-oxoacyl-(acyl-carrier-protein) synthase|nr:AMP-binding protein [Hungatella sp.]
MENKAIMHGEAVTLPKEYETLAGMLMFVAKQYPTHGLTYIDSRGNEDFVSYAELARCAGKKLAALRERGVKPGDHMILVIEQSKEFYQAYWACIFGGMIPAPVSQPSSWEDGADGLLKLSGIWELLGQPKLLIEEKNRLNCEKLVKSNSYKELEFLVTQELVSEKIEEQYRTKADDLIFLQFSSGSTGRPKGVQLTNRNILTNLAGLSERLGVTSQDISFTWVPHTHDMGMFVQHLTPMMKGSNIMVFSPYNFVSSPYLFLSKITEHRGSWFCSTNFGFDWMTRNIPENKLRNLDLSCLRFALNGAEPISVMVTENFIKKFETCGFQNHMMLPSYGMAEATVGISIPLLGDPPKVVSAKRMELIHENRIVECVSSDPDRVDFYREGSALAGVSVRIADDEGVILDENQVGEVQVKGASVTSGYYQREEANRQVFCGEWLRTGDLGFMRDGELVITGRKKDIIFVRGQNYYPHDLEEVIYRHGLVPRGNLVCAGCFNGKTQQEEILVFVKDRLQAETFHSLRKEIIRQMYESLGLDITHVIPVRVIPKTTSGKVQRYQLVKSYEDGDFDSFLLKTEPGMKMETGKSPLVGPGELAEFLHKSWAQILDISPDSFTDKDSIRAMGGNSIRLYQLLNRLESRLGQEVGMNIFIQCGTIAQLAEYGENIRNCKKTYKSKNRETCQRERQPIAITGLAFRLPGARTQIQFWKNLEDKKDCISRVSLSRRALAGEPDWEDWFGEVEDIDSFDYEFFEISKEEALFMDPQQRLMMETAYEALEDAGMVTEFGAERPVGVYAGMNWNGYSRHVSAYVRRMGAEKVHQNALVRNLNNIAAAAIAHQFNFTGPAMALDTACSSFLTGIHQGVRALRNGEINGAVVGGAVVLADKTVHLLAEHAGILSSTNRSKVFDKDADGSVLGEGVIVAYLEPLSEAIKGNKQIYGVVHGTAVNNDGYSLGIMAPNPKGQFQVLEKAYEDAGISPGDISYLEAHGTGTTIGDPIEVNALSKLFAVYGKETEKQSIGIGSVKTNIGHLLPAAGGASLVKVLLSLKNKKLPSSLNMEHLNPSLELEKTPFQVVAETKEWNPSRCGERIAGITSLGLGGTNAHIVVGEWKDKAAAPRNEEQIYFLTVSAKTEVALERMILEMEEYLKCVDWKEMGNVCFTRNRCRKHYEYRAAFLIRTEGNGSQTTVYRGRCTRMKMEVCIEIIGAVENISSHSQDWIRALGGMGIYVRETAADQKGRDRIVLEFAEDQPAPITLVTHDARESADCIKLTGKPPQKDCLYELIARLYVRGVNPNWEDLYPDGTGRMVNLPSYSFEKNHIWIEPEVG